MAPTRLVVLALVTVVLAGCGGFAFSGPGGSTPTPGPLPADTTEASVTAVVDGDTARVAYDNGIEDTVRLVGIDTPEVHTTNDPTEYEGVPDTEAGRDCLRRAGTDASTAAKDDILGATVGLAFDPNTDRRDRYGRLLAYVVNDGDLFNYQLVAQGHARVYTESPFSREAEFLAAERAAREDRRGLWRCTDPDAVTSATDTATPSQSGLALAEINADAGGNDNENLNDEYIVFANRGESKLNITGWTVSDDANHRYTLDRFTLASGARVTLHTGSGTDTDSDLYWGAGSPVWNNGGDIVTVRTVDGSVVLEERY